MVSTVSAVCPPLTCPVCPVCPVYPVCQRHLTKEHYAELVAAVRQRHEDPTDRRFGALVSSEMKMLKMFTISDPTIDALAFLREHDYVSRTVLAYHYHYHIHSLGVVM